MLLAGGEGSRLLTLSRRRAKPAVPFGSIYRIIDFTLSSLMRSEIPVVGVLTQYRPYSLMDHISLGEPWGFIGRKRLAKVLPPYRGEADSDWYTGTADAVYQNFDFINRFPDADVIVVVSGDHIYSMDYRALIERHVEADAELTIACQEVPWEQTGQFGIMVTNEDDRIVDFIEKPKEDPPSNLASLGIYVFRRDALFQRLRADAHNLDSARDFGKDIIPGMIADGRTFAHRFTGYWRDVGTVNAYWRAHMDTLDPSSGLRLHEWRIRTNPNSFGNSNLFPVRVDPPGRVIDSVVGMGCVIEGEARRSVLSPGVRIGRGAVVENSVILHDCVVGVGARLRDVVIDKQTIVGKGAIIGEGDDTPNEQLPDKLNAGQTLIGKAVQIQADSRIGRNVLIGAGAEPCDFPEHGLVPSGACVFCQND